MMKKKIIFFTATIFDKRDFQRFGFKIIEKRGYKVEAWDFSPWHKSDYFNNYKSPIPIKFDGRKLFKTRKQIEKQLSNLSTLPFILFLCFAFLGKTSVLTLCGRDLAKRDLLAGFD